MRSNRQYLLAARPDGMVKASDFNRVESTIGEPADGEVLVRVQYLAVEPAMRGWMENRASYVAPLAIGDLMRGHGAGEVIESKNAAFPVGTRVSGAFGWQEYLLSDGRNVPLQVIPPDVDIPAAMGVLGITGLTAYFGLLEIGRPKPGDTVLVSGAAGATGSIAGQLAKLHGCRVIGIAGTPEKCSWLTGELGFDAAINYRRDDVKAGVREHCPKGIDVYFDNVGGEILDIALARLARGARVVLCGGISRYNEDQSTLAGPRNYFNLVFQRARMEGFIVLDYADRFGEAQQALLQELRSGRLKHRESIIEGFENVPAALISLFTGSNIGKQLVRL